MSLPDNLVPAGGSTEPFELPTADMSVIIVAYNGQESLRETLESILIQTVHPKEIVIVDNNPNQRIEEATTFLKDEFQRKSMKLMYVRNPMGKNLTVARNVGIDHSVGRIAIFLDDDVVLDKEYLSEILRVYENFPNAKGVQGFWELNTPAITFRFRLMNSFNRIFFLLSYGEDNCKLLPSFGHTYPHTLTRIINCQYLSGCDQSYNRSVFAELRFDEKLKRYSFGEDLDFSYRVYKKYPHDLFMTPNARLIHKALTATKSPSIRSVFMKVVYSYYFFYKNIEQSNRNKLIFSWSRIGGLLAQLSPFSLQPVNKRKNFPLSGIGYFIKAQFLCLRHEEEIRMGDLRFIDNFFDD